MTPKITIFLWFDRDALDAARFYTKVFPDSEIRAVHRAPSAYPGGNEGDVLRRLLVPNRDGHSGRNGPLLERDRGPRGSGEPVRLVQGPLGSVVADHAAGADRCARGRR